MIIPTHVDVLLPRRPYANYILMAAICIVSILGFTMPLSFEADSIVYYFIAGGEDPKASGLFLSVFAHLDPFHLAGNMLFQWVFGNAVCAKIGNWRYLFLYFLFALGSALCHTYFSELGAIGASGAINGIIGFYFAMYPRNYVYILYWLYISFFGRTRVPGYVLILFWLGMDLWGVMGGGGMVAYWAHIGGFISGIGVAAFLLKMHWIQFHRIDLPHLFEKMFGRFNVDVIDQEMISACKSLGEKELLVTVGPLDENKVPAKVLAHLMQSGKAQGNDEVYNERICKWQDFSLYFAELAKKSGNAHRNSRPEPSPAVQNYNQQPAPHNQVSQDSGYYVHRDGQNYGPYQMPELQSLLNDGHLEMSSQIYDVSSSNWLTVEALCRS